MSKNSYKQALNERKITGFEFKNTVKSTDEKSEDEPVKKKKKKN